VSDIAVYDITKSVRGFPEFEGSSTSGYTISDFEKEAALSSETLLANH
jgi:hypothetical protein